MKKTIIIKLLCTLLFLYCSITLSQWSRINILETANITVAAKSTNGTLFIGTSLGRIYKSTNNGLHWFKTNFQVDGGTRFTSLITFNDSCVLAALEYEGLYKSTNLGNTWLKSDSGISTFGSNYFCLLKKDNYLFCGTRQVYRSDNYGNFWVSYNNEIGRNHGILCLTTIGNVIFASAQHGASSTYHKSSNNGLNWIAFTGGLPANPNINKFNADSISLYAASSYGGLYWSSNFGTNWLINPFIPSVSSIKSISYGENIVSVGNSNSALYLTSNGGYNWINASTGLPPNCFVNSTVKSGSKIYTFTSKGILSSNYPNINWISSNTGLYELTVNSIYSGQNFILAAPAGLGIIRSTNNGLNWTTITDIPQNEYIRNIISGENNIAAFRGSKIYLSADNGLTWHIINTSFLSIEYLSYSNGEYYLVSDVGIFKSTNNCENWLCVNSNLPDPGFYYAITNLLATDSCVFTTFERISTGGIDTIYKTTDHGATWQMISKPGISNVQIINLSFNNHTVYAGTKSGVFLSTNYGNDWILRDGLTSASVFAFVSDTIYAGSSDSGVYKSTNNGINWLSLNDNIGNKSIRCLSIYNNQLLAGTDESIWQRDIFVNIKQTSENTPRVFKLYQNYPNPFNPTTKIIFDLHNAGNVSLIIYDILGREVAILVNQKQNAGKFEIDWNASNFPSGVYFYKLTSDGFSETKSMLLLK